MELKKHMASTGPRSRGPFKIDSKRSGRIIDRNGTEIAQTDAPETAKLICDMLNADFEGILQDIDRQHDMSLTAQLRYTWRPGTATGQKELERHGKREYLFGKRINELAEVVGLDPICELSDPEKD